jgi:hypothetical protein
LQKSAVARDMPLKEVHMGVFGSRNVFCVGMFAGEENNNMLEGV